MKNIETILKEAGIEVTEEQLTAVNKDVKENYRTITDYDKQKEKLDTATAKVTTLTESLEKFKGVDADALNQTIEDLKGQIAKKDTEYAEKIAARDFNDLLSGAIRDAKGKNAKAITALLDLDTLKASKNQKDDITAALADLAKAEDSAMLFASADPDPEPDVIGKGGIIGSVHTGGGNDSAYNSLRASMGLAPKEKG